MHIALINQWFPPDYGGVSVYNSAMARAYAALGHEVTVITARSAADQPAVADEDGARVHRVERWVEPYAARRLALLGGHIRALRHIAYSHKVCALLDRAARRDGIDVVEFAEVNAEGLLAALHGNRLPTVVRCHLPHAGLRRQATPEDRLFDTTLIERAEAAFIRRATALTAPSAYLARFIEQEAGLRAGRVIVIPNGIDVDAFSPASRRGNPQGEEPLMIVHVGRLERMKGCFVLAQALDRLAAQERSARPAYDYAPWRAVFVGGDRTDIARGSNRARLEHFITDNGLADRVELRGPVARPDLVELYRAADICVVPSLHNESFSYTCLEAMACGRPVVATTMGGIPEVVIDGETGLLVPPGDPVALAAALRRLIGDARLRRRLGRAGRERAVRLYAHHTVAQQNLAVYAEVINGQHGRVTHARA